MRVIVPKDMSQDPIPAGGYKAIFSKLKRTVSKAGNPLLWFTFKILSEGNDPKAKTLGRTVTDQCTLTEDSMWRVNGLYKACTGKDIPAREYEEDELVAEITKAVTNKELFLTVELDTYQGQTRNKIKEFKKLG